MKLILREEEYMKKCCFCGEAEENAKTAEEALEARRNKELELVG